MNSRAERGAESSLYTWYAVGLLTTAYVFSYLDRSILTLLIKPIRDDFGISDTQISLLHGFAFAIFYVGLGVPMGWLADRSHRVRLVTAGIGVWSVFTAACGLTRNFFELFLMRMMVGVGESILNPCAYSIITDTARRRHLSLALSIYTMGIYLGGGLALVLGGLVIRTIAEQPSLSVPFIGDIASWKSAFFIVGIPGILLMLLVGKTLREPVRTGLMNPDHARHVSLSDVISFVRLNRHVLFFHFLGFSLIQLMANALGLWIPTFFSRSHGWEVAEAGIVFGVLLMICGPLGALFGGWCADRYDGAKRLGGPFVVGAGLSVVAIIPATISTLVESPLLAFVLLGLLILSFSGPIALGVSALQQITPNELRGQISAIYLLIVNLLGIGFGPTLVALVTDFVFGSDDALATSLASVCGSTTAVAALLLFVGRKSFRRSLERAQQWS